MFILSNNAISDFDFYAFGAKIKYEDNSFNKRAE